MTIFLVETLIECGNKVVTNEKICFANAENALGHYRNQVERVAMPFVSEHGYCVTECSKTSFKACKPYQFNGVVSVVVTAVNVADVSKMVISVKRGYSI